MPHENMVDGWFASTLFKYSEANKLQRSGYRFPLNNKQNNRELPARLLLNCSVICGHTEKLGARRVRLIPNKLLFLNNRHPFVYVRGFIFGCRCNSTLVLFVCVVVKTVTNFYGIGWFKWTICCSSLLSILKNLVTFYFITHLNLHWSARCSPFIYLNYIYLSGLWSSHLSFFAV